MKVAITGSNGFIGGYLVNKLSDINIPTVLIDQSTGIDILKMDQLTKVPKFDTLIHLAALTYVPDSYKRPHEFYLTNISGLINTIELCRLYNAKMIFFSSYVYGVPQYLPIDELHPLSPFNPYAQSKIIGEEICQAYHRDFNVPIIIFRPFNIYGKGQHEDFIIPSILKQLKSGKIRLKDPKPKRDYIHIEDIVDACLKALLYSKTNFEIFNLGFGKSFSIAEIIDNIMQITQLKVEINFSNEVRPHEVQDTVACIKKANQLLDWYPTFDIYEGLKKLLK